MLTRQVSGNVKQVDSYMILECRAEASTRAMYFGIFSIYIVFNDKGMKTEKRSKD